MNKKNIGRLLLLLTFLLAGYQVVKGIEGLDSFPTVMATVGFGVLIVASLLLIIFGIDFLSSPLTASVSSIIPLSLAGGISHQFLPQFKTAYLVFAAIGLLAILTTRFLKVNRSLQTLVLAVIHSIAGVIIVFVPIYLVASGQISPLLLLVSLGGLLMGVAGLFLGLLHSDRLKQPKENIYLTVVGILTAAALCFVAGSKALG